MYSSLYMVQLINEETCFKNQYDFYVLTEVHLQKPCAINHRIQNRLKDCGLESSECISRELHYGSRKVAC